MTGPSHLFCPACRPLSPRKRLRDRRRARARALAREAEWIAWAETLAKWNTVAETLIDWYHPTPTTERNTP